MEIKLNLSPMTAQGIHQKSDIFDLDINSTELRIAHNETAPITSVSLCTPGCGMNGTGNSFCCSCK